MINNRKKGFTLVELLAVIVILAIILVIAIPKVMSVIEDSKKATLESTAKMIASAAEKQKVQNTVLGNNEEITCDSVTKLNDVDYANCNIEFDNNTAKVTIEGKGKFEGLNVCGGTKSDATAIEGECPTSKTCFTYDDTLQRINFDFDEEKCKALVANQGASTEEINKACTKGALEQMFIVLIEMNHKDININEIVKAYEDEKIISNVKYIDSITITNYNATCGSEVVIPEYIDGKIVTGISRKAMYKKGITKLKLPNSIDSIKEGAFSYNQISGELDLTNTKVITIEDDAFSLNYITSVKIPNTILSIGSGAFMNFYEDSLTKVYLGNVNAKLGNCAFGFIDSAVHNLPDSYSCVVS